MEFPEGAFQRLLFPPLLPRCSRFGRQLLQILAHQPSQCGVSLHGNFPHFLHNFLIQRQRNIHAPKIRGFLIMGKLNSQPASSFFSTLDREISSVSARFAALPCNEIASISDSTGAYSRAEPTPSASAPCRLPPFRDSRRPVATRLSSRHNIPSHFIAPFLAARRAAAREFPSGMAT